MSEFALISIFHSYRRLYCSCWLFWRCFGEGGSGGCHAIAQQPDAAPTLSRTLFVSLAMVESSGIYCFVVALILIFANPFWDAAQLMAGG